MLESSFPAFVFAPAGVTWKPIRELLERLKSIQVESLVITDRSNREAQTNEKNVVTIPAALVRKSAVPEELFTAIPYVIPGQMFAASLAEVKGLDPDKPRTLSKVTLTL
jgi:glucosamine--fructose-6-phosphate aminotransferase (isomerizing)